VIDDEVCEYCVEASVVEWKRRQSGHLEFHARDETSGHRNHARVGIDGSNLRPERRSDGSDGARPSSHVKQPETRPDAS
jgi:hypothetical protein